MRYELWRNLCILLLFQDKYILYQYRYMLESELIP